MLLTYIYRAGKLSGVTLRPVFQSFTPLHRSSCTNRDFLDSCHFAAERPLGLSSARLSSAPDFTPSCSSPSMSGQYPPHDGRGPYPSSSPYADPFGDTQQASHAQRQDSSQASYGAHLGGDLSGGGAGPQRYSLSDTPSFQGSTQTLPTASSYSLADPDQEKSYDGGYHGQDDDDEARPLRDGYNGGGGFYRPEGQE